MTAMSARLHNLLQGAGSLLSVQPPVKRVKRKKLYKPSKSATEALRKDCKHLNADLREAAQKVLNGEK